MLLHALKPLSAAAVQRLFIMTLTLDRVWA